MRREAEEDRANQAPAEEMEKCVGPSVGRGLTDGLGSRNSKNATAPRSSSIPDVETGSGMYPPAVKREANPALSSATLGADP